MNTKNNKRGQTTTGSIESIFIELLQTRDISRITVTDICQRTGYNRSTFYAHYMDIYDLADKIRDKLEAQVRALYDENMLDSYGIDYLKLFRHIRDNQLFYTTYFKLGYDSQHIVDLDSLYRPSLPFAAETLDYHVAFHKAGLNAIIKKWLAAGCKESPETMVQIIVDEYSARE